MVRFSPYGWEYKWANGKLELHQFKIQLAWTKRSRIGYVVSPEGTDFLALSATASLSAAYRSVESTFSQFRQKSTSGS